MFSLVRLDRFITLNAVRPWRGLFGSSGAPTTDNRRPTAVPVLMYHSISDDPEPGVSPYYKVNTSSAVFRHQMQYLADHGYRSLTVTELVSWMSDHRRLTPDHRALVCLTFDDGFRDFYTEAFPVLQRHGFTAAVFLPTAFIGDDRRQFRPAASGRCAGASGRECLTWPEVLELRRAGIEFGSHTVSHPKLVELEWSRIRAELTDSRSAIEQRLQERVTEFCHPYAFPQGADEYAGRFRQLLAEAGYSSCLTTELGRARLGDDRYRLKRLPVNALDDTALFAAKLQGSYDWLARPQALVKAVKRRLGSSKPRSSTPPCPAPAGSR